jgi:hypothetical protein
MDFDKLLAEKTTLAPTEPRELYASLPDKAKGYGYLRDVQGQVLTAWHERRHIGNHRNQNLLNSPLRHPLVTNQLSVGKWFSTSPPR